MQFDQLRRRDFITLLGGAAATWPLDARAQQQMPVIGLLSSVTARQWAPFVSAFLQGLNELGFIEGQNVVAEQRWAGGQYERLPAMAADLIQRQVAVIAALTTPAAVAAKAATATTPIVFTTIGDPVQIGLVPSLSRPNGNMTGVTYLNVEVAPKLLELLHEVIPTTITMAALLNPTNPNAAALSRSLQDAARTLGLQLHVLKASTESDIETALVTLAELRAGGVVIPSDVFIITHEERLAAWALQRRMPAVFQGRSAATAGGLMSYSGNALDVYRQAGVYTGRILKGAKPADLPVVQSTKFELVINHQTAKILNLTVPPTLLATADEVIE